MKNSDLISAIQHLYVSTKQDQKAFTGSPTCHLLLLPGHTDNAALSNTPTQLLTFSPPLYHSKDKRLSRQTAANKHHCNFGSHSELSENHWHKSSSPFPSLCQEFHSMAFLIMSMNKTPAFSDTSNTAFHLLLYWHVFKVSAHYKKTTHFYCLHIQLGAGSLGVQQNRGKTQIIPCYQTSDTQRVYKVS